MTDAESPDTTQSTPPAEAPGEGAAPTKTGGDLVQMFFRGLGKGAGYGAVAGLAFFLVRTLTGWITGEWTLMVPAQRALIQYVIVPLPAAMLAGLIAEGTAEARRRLGRDHDARAYYPAAIGAVLPIIYGLRVWGVAGAPPAQALQALGFLVALLVVSFGCAAVVRSFLARASAERPLLTTFEVALAEAAAMVAGVTIGTAGMEAGAYRTAGYVQFTWPAGVAIPMLAAAGVAVVAIVHHVVVRIPPRGGIRAAWVLLIAMAVLAGLHRPPAAARNDGPMLVVLQVDGLRADAVTQGDTPNLWGLYHGDGPAVRLPEFTSVSPWDLPAAASLATGTWPATHQVSYDTPAAIHPDALAARGWNAPSLAGTLRDAGYLTAALINDPAHGELSGLDRDFQEVHALYSSVPVYRDPIGSGAAERRSLRRLPDSERLKYALRTTFEKTGSWLSRRSGDPSYLHVQLPALRFPLPIGWRSEELEPVFGGRQVTLRTGGQLANRFPQEASVGMWQPSGSDMDVLLGVYRLTLREFDAALGVFLEDLESAGLRDDVLLCVVGTHGAAFFEHRAVGAGFTVHRENSDVPCILSGPGADRVRAVPGAQQPDLAVTLADLLGAGVPEGMEGDSLVGDDAPEATWPAVCAADAAKPFLDELAAIYRESDHDFDAARIEIAAMRDGTWKYISIGDRERLYNVERDPVEGNNLVAREEGRARADRMAQELERWRAAHPPAGSGGPEALAPAGPSERLLRLIANRMPQKARSEGEETGR